MTRTEGKILARTFATSILEYAENSNIHNLVLGLSGGLDSTVCAALCWLACKEAKKEGYKLELTGVSLPCSSNKEDENDIAFQCSYFCDRFDVMNLEDTFVEVEKTCNIGMDQLYGHYSLHGHYIGINPFGTPISAGNIKARLRMIYLYNIASITKGLVIDTDNLTEHFLGFWTLHGDEGDLNPIGSLWKTEVYQLAECIIEVIEDMYVRSTDDEQVIENAKSLHMVDALRKAIDITPTDGNGVMDGGDLAQIAPGHTYNDVDDILKTYIEYRGHHSEEYIIEMDRLFDTYGKETVDKVINRMNSSEYKRKHRPLVFDLKGNVIENETNVKFAKREGMLKD